MEPYSATIRQVLAAVYLAYLELGRLKTAGFLSHASCGYAVLALLAGQIAMGMARPTLTVRARPGHSSARASVAVTYQALGWLADALGWWAVAGAAEVHRAAPRRRRAARRPRGRGDALGPLRAVGQLPSVL
jgi:hypothetical protein